MKILMIFVLIFFVTGCAPDRFTLNYRADYLQFGKILDDLDSFEQINDNSFKLKSGRVAIKTPASTQSRLSFNLKISEGDSVRITMRTVENEYDNKKGITFLLLKSAIEVYEDGKMIKSQENIKSSSIGDKYINIRTVGDLLKFSRDCDDITVKTELPATEFLIISAPGNTEILVTGIEFEGVMENPSERVINY